MQIQLVDLQRHEREVERTSDLRGEGAGLTLQHVEVRLRRVLRELWKTKEYR